MSALRAVCRVSSLRFLPPLQSLSIRLNRSFLSSVSSSSSSSSSFSCLSSSSSSSSSSGQRRCYAARSSSAADSYLVEVLKAEIEHELHEEADKQGSLKGSAGPFELVDKPGTEEVILKRAFGNEQIAVTCLLESEYPEEDEEAEEEAAEDETTERAHNESEEEEEEESVSDHVDILRFTVTITKETPMPALEFECSFFRGADEVTIEAVSFLNEDLEKAENDEEPRPYEGPDFNDLDETLQRAFQDLLKARGLSAKVATYVMDYLSLKEHREYMRWLHNLETFFASP